MEAKDWHLPVTPFHGGLQKIKGKVDGFTERIREATLDECSYEHGKSRGKLPRFLARIEDLQLKCCMDYRE